MSWCAMPVIGRLIEQLDDSVRKTFAEETVKSLISNPDAVACEIKRNPSSNG